MHLATALAVVFALVVSLNSDSTPVEAMEYRLLLIAACAVVVVGAARSLVNHQVPRVLADRCQNTLVLLFTFFAYVVQDYGRIVKGNWQLDRFILIDELVLVAPLVGTLLLTWAFQHRTSRHLSLLDLRHAMTVARHQLMLPLIPVIVVLTTADIAKRLSPNSVVESVMVVAVLSLLVVMAPLLLRFCWHTQPFPPGERRRELELVFLKSKLSLQDIRIWKTDHRVVNAVLAGILPVCRFLFLTDELLARLRDDRLKAIVAHEAGHIRHGHLFQLFLSLQIPLLSMLLMQQMLEHYELPTQSIQWFAVVGLFLGWLFVHARIARAFEHQADVAACHILTERPRLDEEVVAIYGDALTLAAGPSSGADWLHPSVTTRLAMLRHLSTNPTHEKTFEIQIRRLRMLLIAIVASLLVSWLTLLLINSAR